MNVAIIGAGLIGKKRAMVLKRTGDRLVAVADVDFQKAKGLALEFEDCMAFRDWQKVILEKSVEVVIICTPHNQLAKIAFATLKNYKHVLCEKPLGVSVDEIEKCVEQSKEGKLVYAAGYNHRFHPAIFKAHGLFINGEIGNLMFIKTAYGHGGREGYEKEWRMDKKISGGGELLDQGSHLIDLSLWFMGRVEKSKGELITSFWPVSVEDNAFILLRNKNSVVAQLHASWTEWKNRFVFEIYGTTGYLKVNGLGGSYGLETLTFGQRLPGKPPKEKVWEFPGEDLSWEEEWINFKGAIKGNERLLTSGEDGLKVLKIIREIYEG